MNTYVLGVSYSHTREAGEVRPSVNALNKIVDRLNETFGESNIVFDGNESFKDKFDRNGAVQESLELYRKCSYYIILDDNHYCDGDNCPREASVIKEQLQKYPETLKQHVWFLRPKNDKGSKLFNPDKDFSRMLDYTEENIKEIVDAIVRVIMEDHFN